MQSFSLSLSVKGRLLIVRAEMNGSVLCFVNIYAPNQGSDRAGLFTKIQSELRTTVRTISFLAVISTVQLISLKTEPMKSHTHNPPSV